MSDRADDVYRALVGLTERCQICSKWITITEHAMWWGGCEECWPDTYELHEHEQEQFLYDERKRAEADWHRENPDQG